MPFYGGELKFGQDNENKIKSKIENFFNRSLKKYEEEKQNIFSKYDFETVEDDNKIIFEVKTMRNKTDAFDCVILGRDKIEGVEKINGDLYFIYNFINENKIYYIKYSKFLFRSFKTAFFIRKDRINDKKKEHIFIPFKLLTELN